MLSCYQQFLTRQPKRSHQNTYDMWLVAGTYDRTEVPVVSGTIDNLLKINTLLYCTRSIYFLTVKNLTRDLMMACLLLSETRH